jgi:hypothetical protein
MANQWLLKTDPKDRTDDKLERNGSAVWDGMTYNPALQSARKTKKAMRLIATCQSLRECCVPTSIKVPVR